MCKTGQEKIKVGTARDKKESKKKSKKKYNFGESLPAIDPAEAMDKHIKWIHRTMCLPKSPHCATIDLVKQLNHGIICIPYCEGMKEGSKEQKAYVKSYLQMLKVHNIINEERLIRAMSELELDK